MNSAIISDLFSVTNKVILVSGASRGIGYYIASQLSAIGATVYGIGRSALAKQPDFEYVQCDLANYQQLHECIDQITAKEGRIDILINAAGISLRSEKNVYSRSNFIDTLTVNLIAINDCCRLVSDIMKENGGGVILNVTSIGSKLSFPENPGYLASKAGLAALSKSLAHDLAPHRIRVNNLAPGYFHTDMTDKSFNDPVLSKKRTDRMMIQRWGEVHDLLGSVIYLISDASSYVTGIDLFVDGGWTSKGL